MPHKAKDVLYFKVEEVREYPVTYYINLNEEGNVDKMKRLKKMFRRRRREGIENKEEGCGVKFLFHTTPDDPFFTCCLIHDDAYDNIPPTESTKDIDEKFYECCLAIAGQDKPLRARAKLYYYLCRLYGKGRWVLGKLGLWRFWE